MWLWISRRVSLFFRANFALKSDEQNTHHIYSQRRIANDHTESPYRSYEKEMLDHQCEHIRLIHFSLLAVNALLFYLVFSNWTMAPEVLAELSSLRNLATAVSQRNIEALRKHAPELTARCINSSTDALKVTGGNFDEIVNLPGSHDILMKMEVPESIKDPENVTIENIYNSLLDQKGLLMCINDFAEKKTVQYWLENNVKIEPNRLPVIWDSSTWEKNVVNIVDFQLYKWPDRTDAKGSFCANFSVERQAYSPPDPPVRAKWTTFKTYDYPVRVCSAFDAVNVGMIQDDFWAKFPSLKRLWPNVHRLSLAQAQQWAEGYQMENLNKKNINLLGIDVEGKHIGLIGPMTVFCLLMYMIAYTRQLRTFVQNHPERESLLPFSSAWVGAAPNGFAAAISVSTLIILPQLSIIFTLWRFVNSISSITISLVAVFSAVLSTLIYCEGRCLAGYFLMPQMVIIVSGESVRGRAATRC